MTISSLGHYTIRCTQQKLSSLRAFYTDVLGLQEGARPDFPFPGHWLYCGAKPIVHLYASASSDTDARTGSLDHVAFDAEGVDAVRYRLLDAGVPFDERPVAGYPLHQVFVHDPAGIKLEMTFPASSVDTKEDTRLSVNGTRLAHEVAGAGPALLLLHGGAGSLRMFDKLVPWLSSSFRVIRYDQRDCGASEKSERAYDFEALADDAAAVLSALDESKAHIFGTSFGGLLAQAIAMRHPRCVDRLVLSSTWELGVPFSRMNPEASRILGNERTPETQARAFFSKAFIDRDANAADFFRRMGPGMSDARAALLKQERATQVSSIDAKTLVLGGEDDRIVPFEQSRLLSQRIPNTQLAEPLPHVGHICAVEDPEKVAELVRAFCSPSSPKE